MFADEVADLKDAYPARTQIVHVLSREPQRAELLTGRLDAARLTELLPRTVDVTAVDHWWLCGPYRMVTGATGVLRAMGVDQSRIHRELFWVEDEPPTEATHEEAPEGDGAAVTITLDGRVSTFTLPAGTPVLDGAARVRPDLPFACKSGVCGTCRARVTRGEAVMRRNYALEEHEVRDGYVLTCQALPRTEAIAVDYDA
jgi:ring-1,2-phenylacetyl-CoA epoxidase subunit PaaE